MHLGGDRNGAGQCHPINGIRPLCALFIVAWLDFTILNFLIASLFFLVFASCYASVRSSTSFAFPWSFDAGASRCVGTPSTNTSTQVPTRNVSENDLSLVSCNLNRKKVNCTDNIRRPTLSVRRRKRQPYTKKGYDLSRLTSPTPSRIHPPSPGLQGSRGAPRDRCEICRTCCKTR